VLSRREFLERSAALALAFAPGFEWAAPSPRRLRELRAAVRGPVLAPGSAGYDAARRLFNTRFDGVRPPAVVQALDADDVRAVVRWANRYDVPLVSRSGGHAYNGSSTSRDAVVVDVGRLNGVALSGTTATVGPGARSIDVYAALAARGATIPSGSCPLVAVGGLVLSGGMGLAGRALGLTLDRVTSFDVVTADGRPRRVSTRSDEDLFWALRGGGGSFAIVTAVRLRAYRVRRAAWFFASFPGAARDETLAAWDELAPGAPPELTSICTLTGEGATVLGQYLGTEPALRRLIAPLARIPGADVSAGTSDYLPLQRRWAGCADGGLSSCHRNERTSFDASSIYVAKRLSAAGRRAFVTAADTGATLVLDAYGGAINRVRADATAFVHRDVRYSVQILSYAPIAAARAHVRKARALIGRYGNGGAYPNYPDLDLTDPLHAYYGANLPRLRAIKRDVDPHGRFDLVQGIKA
jgi:FAD/FMN-containing dehydrogenase